MRIIKKEMGNKMSYGLNEMMDYDLDENMLLYIYTTRLTGAWTLVYISVLFAI